MTALAVYVPYLRRQGAGVAQLEVYQSIWGMEELPWKSSSPWSHEEQMDRIAEAGFDGAEIDFVDMDEARAFSRLAIDRGLRIRALCFPETTDELSEVLETIGDVGPEHVNNINVLPMAQPLTIAECVPILESFRDLADDAGVEMHVETHRASMTNDLLFTIQLLDAVPWMNLTADLSHYVVARQFPWPIDDTSEQYIQRILARAVAFHGRVATSSQVQVPLGFPQNKQWLDLFAGWWKAGFRQFRNRAPSDARLTFTAELGPPGWFYALTGPDGLELSDRWAEALLLKDLARELWASLDEEPAEIEG